MPRHKKITSVYLEHQQHEDLKELSAVTRVPIAVYIREGVSHILAKYAKALEVTSGA